MKLPGMVALTAAVALVMVGGAWAADDKDKKEPPKAEAKDGKDIQYQDDEEEVAPPEKNPGEKQPEEVRADAVDGGVELSDGKKLAGKVYLTQDKTISFFDAKDKKKIAVTLAELNSIENRVVVERMEKEWRWKENASDEKVFTGKEYPMREYETVLSFKNGKVMTGECTALIYVRTANGENRFIIHKRDKGEVGQTLKDLVYVKMVDLRKPSETEKKTEETK